MKPHLCLCLFLAVASILTAQDQPKDPFVKDKQAVASVPAAAEAPTNILCLVETFTLPQADYAALLDAPDGRDKMHANVLAAVKAGTAKLDGCHWITGKSGTRCTVESSDELIYPKEWLNADSTGFQNPWIFEMHPLGDRFEFEPTLDLDKGAAGIIQAFSRDRLLGMRMSKADATLAGVPVMNLFEQGGTSNCRVIPGIPALLSTLNDSQPGAITLVVTHILIKIGMAMEMS